MKIELQGKKYDIRWKHQVPVYTECWLQTEDKLIISTHRAVKSKNDNFSREYGRTLSLKRLLMANYWITKEERKKVWTEYFKYTKKNYSVL